MELAEKLKEILGVIESAEVVYLSTIDENGYPSTRAMLNLKNKKQYPHLISMYTEESNQFTVYLTTNTSSAKIKEIGNNAKASLYFCKPESFTGTMLQGKIEIVTDSEFKHNAWMKGWELYYPGGIDSEDFSMLRFVPFSFKTYSDFQVETEKID
ncbi:pyridoxamine 5'-phosphate oxidase family protein [uncultured Bacteroides sp.]|uniref:pyridoxamine 5'-phosphate oxidase family protein n=1 Tax=uncultured Bacteroides sp. TaxID=162156 RepID=UPI002AAA94D3|nr:pyridoxamine 5'-phosphate oxidase family protein [uncultured Bacteroides sp.]